MNGNNFSFNVDVCMFFYRLCNRPCEYINLFRCGTAIVCEHERLRFPRANTGGSYTTQLEYVIENPRDGNFYPSAFEYIPRQLRGFFLQGGLVFFFFIQLILTSTSLYLQK